ncbi:hypothetical protein [Jannaschia formosa]|nr:hypothetical protein [Jannaschia formosa]
MISLKTHRLAIVSVAAEDHADLRAYYLANADHLKATESLGPDGYHDAGE